MQVKASLNNIRMAPRKVRLVANMINGMAATRAKHQLTFLIRKPAPLILKLLNSALANAKHDFSVEEDNLFIKSIVVESGATLKRWMPRAMGRAAAIRKRTCCVKITLDELKSGTAKKSAPSKAAILKADEVLPEAKERKEWAISPAKEIKPKGAVPQKPFGASSQSKAKNFSRRTFGNIKKVFRRKSI